MIDRILNCRAELGDLCNELGITKAVEIGTHQGVFADQFLSRFFGTLICVDPWHCDSPPPYEHFLPYYVPNSPSRQFDMEIAKVVLASKHPGKSQLWKMTSLEASSRITDESIGFVYIDGLHDLPHVKEDLAAWWPKVQPGGIIAGHDYCPDDPTLRGVTIAVDRFAYDHGLDLHFTRESNEPPSWYARKPA